MQSVLGPGCVLLLTLNKKYGLIDCVHVLSLHTVVNSQHATIQVYPPCMKTCTAHPPTLLHTQIKTQASRVLIVSLCVQRSTHTHRTWCVLITQNMGTVCICAIEFCALDAVKHGLDGGRSRAPHWTSSQYWLVDFCSHNQDRTVGHNRILFCPLCSVTEVGNDMR